MSEFNFLSRPDQRIVQAVLGDLDRVIDGGWVLAGSLSFRLLLPEHLRSSRLGDIDVAVFPRPGEDIAALVSPRVKKTFFVSHIYGNDQDGYYFGLVHKATGRWIDIYTYAREPNHRKFLTGSREVGVQAIEETLFAIVKDLLWRAREHKLVKQKWLSTTRLLWDSVDRHKLAVLMSLRASELERLIPGELVKSPSQVVEYVLAHVKVFAPASMPVGQPDDCVVTGNGIMIEPPERYRKP